MKKTLEFQSPFWEWGGMGFFNCYAAVYMHLQSISATPACHAKNGKSCDNCNACSDVLNNLFSVIQGQWITRQSWSGEKTKAQKEFDEYFGNSSNATEQLVDFLIGFTGYDYKKLESDYKDAIVKSIDNGKPVIAKLKEDSFPTDFGKGYRVIIGYDEDSWIEPDYKPAANYNGKIDYNEMECIYVFGDKVTPTYQFTDVLKLMEKAMDTDFSEGIWYEFSSRFDFEGQKVWTVSDTKKRFERLGSVMGWVPNIAHGLQTAFRNHQLLENLGVDLNQFRDFLDVIAKQTHLLHNRGYMLSAICDTVSTLDMDENGNWPWDKHGLITAAQQILDSIIDCDLKILMAIKKAIHKRS